MALSEASILQKNQGSFEAASGIATLPSGTTDGSTVLIIAWANGLAGQLQIPAGFEQDIVPIGLGSSDLYAWRRKGVPANESSWTVQTIGETGLILWFAYEINGVDFTEPLDQWQTHGATGVTSISTGTTPQTSVSDIACFAVHGAFSLTTISGQTNGFVEGEELSQSSVTYGDATVAISRLYPGAAGQYECTATLGAAATALGTMLVYRAVGELPVDPGGEVLTG